MITDTCRCGKPKAHKCHLACNACLAKVPDEIRREFIEHARHKRGAPSYFAARRRLVAELDKIHTAGRDSEPGHRSDATGTNPPGAAPGAATTTTGAA